MFQWLYNRIESLLSLSHSQIDQEVPAILNEKSIAKSQIAAVGGIDYGTFLGMLLWIMHACQLAQGQVMFEALKDAHHAWRLTTRTTTRSVGC